MADFDGGKAAPVKSVGMPAGLESVRERWIRGDLENHRKLQREISSVAGSASIAFLIQLDSGLRGLLSGINRGLN